LTRQEHLQSRAKDQLTLLVLECGLDATELYDLADEAILSARHES
jgi:hypothetical protein